MDERFLLHRLKSTSLAAVVGAVTLGGWYLYQMIAHGVYRRDLLVIAGLMAITKVTAMLYYRLKN
jgi:hypothetical protein